MVHYSNSYRVKNRHTPFSEPLPYGSLLSDTPERVMTLDTHALLFEKALVYWLLYV